MRRVETLYLAGPEVWYPNVGAHFGLRQHLCAESGFTILAPDTDALRELEPGEIMAREIYAERIARMRRADAGIINLTPWRGPAADWGWQGRGWRGHGRAPGTNGAPVATRTAMNCSGQIGQHCGNWRARHRGPRP